LRLAAIDIGSNSIKLIVVEATTDDSFAVLAREKEVVRLGHDTLRAGRLSPTAIERGIDCLNRFRSIAEARGATEVITVATASVREADNALEFIEEAQRRAGVRIEVLSSIEEARLIGLAVAQSYGAGVQTLLNVDIGGGSTEISLVRDGVPSELFSVKLGAVGLTEQFITTDPVKHKELRALREEIRAALERPRRELGGGKWKQATGTSGTILAIGEALRLRRLRLIDRGASSAGAQPSGVEINFSQLERFNDEMANMKIIERRGVPGISSQRSEIIVAGGQILEGVMRALEIKSLRTCDWALREGVIINQLREMDAESRPPVPDVADPGLRGVLAVGRRFGYEEAHAHQVTMLAEKIFDRMAVAYKLSRHQRTLLSAATLLHDVGYHIAHESHHKHSLYLIKHSELTGFSEAERHVIANVARYHKGALPKERHADFGALNEQDQETVWRLGAILRVADALDKGYSGIVRDVRSTIEGSVIHIQLRSDFNCEKEIWAAEQKRDMFEQAFGCRLIFSRRALAKPA
jgi:exopolyphosphatase / guanosine-5'-triphosphate,3'-diphosphate pyrophosphatase